MTHAKELEGQRGALAPVVLVVEDHEDTRDMVVAWVEAHGFRTMAATNGLEAVACLSRGVRPAMIVLDLRMPAMSGWEVLRWLKEHGDLSAIPVVITSAELERPPGAKYYLRKPLNGGALEAL